jgi:hypothetical protein
MRATHYVEPLTVVFYAGPGTGKSTTTAATFAALKQRGDNVEIVHEYAKDLVWEGRSKALSYQPYVIAKQMWHMDRLRGEVPVILTDTSTLLALVYGKGLTDAFKEWVIDDYRRRNTLNIFLHRDPQRPYNPKGRQQTEEQAKAKDTEILGMLHDLEIPTETVWMRQDSSHIDEIVNLVSAAYWN